MSFLRSLISAFSCFSKIPMPQLPWRDDSMRYMLALFPLVGVAVAVVLWLWLALCDAAGLGDVLRGVGIVLIPVAVTGGIHLDGLCDVVDAQSSHAPMERKREILKDPHAGAFASIGLGAYLLLYLGLATELPHIWQLPLLMGSAYVMERVLSAAAVIAFPKSSKKGMAAAESEAAARTVSLVVLAVLYVAVAAVAIAALPMAGVAMAVASFVVLAWLHRFTMKEFGGMSGDLAGFFAQICEIALVAVLVVAAKVAGL